MPLDELLVVQAEAARCALFKKKAAVQDMVLAISSLAKGNHVEKYLAELDKAAGAAAPPEPFEGIVSTKVDPRTGRLVKTRIVGATPEVQSCLSELNKLLDPKLGMFKAR